MTDKLLPPHNPPGYLYPEQITDEFLTCFVCQVPGFRHKPKVLACGHTFCQSCLESLERGGAVACPRCAAPTRLPAGGVAELSTNVFFDAQIDRLLRRHNAALGRDDSWYNIRDFNVSAATGHASF